MWRSQANSPSRRGKITLTFGDIFGTLFRFNEGSERSAARLAHYLGVVGVAGSNPAVPTFSRLDTLRLDSPLVRSFQAIPGRSTNGFPPKACGNDVHTTMPVMAAFCHSRTLCGHPRKTRRSDFPPHKMKKSLPLPAKTLRFLGSSEESLRLRQLSFIRSSSRNVFTSLRSSFNPPSAGRPADAVSWGCC